MEKGKQAVLARESRPSNSRGEALKQDRAIRSRQQILDSAAEAFASGGYSSVTIADVAQGAGMTKGAVYFHFANKEALAVALAESFYQRWTLLYQEIEALRLAPVDAVAEFLRRTGRLFHDDRVVQAGARLQIEHELLGTQILPEPFATYHRLVLELLEQAHAHGALRPGVDVQALARVVTGAAFGAQHMSWVVGDWADVNDRMAEVVDLILEPWRAVD